MRVQRLGVACLLLAATITVQCLAKNADFFEDFGSGWDSRWIQSSDAKYNGKFEVESPKSLNDQALKVSPIRQVAGVNAVWPIISSNIVRMSQVPVKARHYGISTRLPEVVKPSKGLALQYELKLQEGLSCGGAYLKFVSDSKDYEPSSLKEATPYTVMFGADKCGSTNKVQPVYRSGHFALQISHTAFTTFLPHVQVHLILRHQKPNGDIEEKHLNSPPSVNLDKLTHVYTAIIDDDNT